MHPFALSIFFNTRSIFQEQFKGKGKNYILALTKQKKKKKKKKKRVLIK